MYRMSDHSRYRLLGSSCPYDEAHQRSARELDWSPAWDGIGRARGGLQQRPGLLIPGVIQDSSSTFPVVTDRLGDSPRKVALSLSDRRAQRAKPRSSRTCTGGSPMHGELRRRHESFKCAGICAVRAAAGGRSRRVCLSQRRLCEPGSCTLRSV